MEQPLETWVTQAVAFIKAVGPLFWVGGLLLAVLLVILATLALKRKKSRKKTRETAATPVKDSGVENRGLADEISAPYRPPGKSTLFDRLKNGLAKTRRYLSNDIDALFQNNREFDDDLLEKLEELLITADIGVQTSMDLIQRLSKKIGRISDPDQLKAELKSEIADMLNTRPTENESLEAKPHVIMVVGVNGVGKTTTIGKLAARYAAEGKKVLIAAADTFRAAAGEQIQIWARRAEAKIVRHKENSDPAAVAYDAIEAAIARGADVVFIDTAGRLHTKVNLMEELKKIKRTVNKRLPGAPHDILLVLDATTGQNGLSQAQMFHQAMGITGIALTKLDGTAKGGIVVSIGRSMDTPLKYIGVGEKIEDLQDFNAAEFVEALF